MSRPLPLLASAMACLALAACASSGGDLAQADARREGDGVASVPAAPEWVESPSAGWDEQAHPLQLQVTGSAVIVDGLAAAEKAARADALAALSAFLDGALSRLDAPAAPPSGLVTALQSARVLGKFHDGRRYFVWMACDAGAALTAQATPELRDELARLVADRQRR